MLAARIGVVTLVTAGATACARPNPAFDPESEPTEGADDDDGGVASRTSGSLDDEGKTSPSDASVSASTSPGGATEPVSDDAPALDTGDEGDTGVTGCGFAPDFAPFLVEITVGAQAMELQCGQTHTLQGPVDRLGIDGIGMVDCGSCEPCGGEVAFVFLEGAGLELVPPAITPICARVEVVMGAEADGCVPEVAIISDAFGMQSSPEIIVTNRREPPLLPLLAPPVPDLVEPLCDQLCSGDLLPGEYGLSFDNGDTVEPGAVVQGIALATFDGSSQEPYAVHLRYGAVDGECHEIFGWTATRDPL